MEITKVIADRESFEEAADELVRASDELKEAMGGRENIINLYISGIDPPITFSLPGPYLLLFAAFLMERKKNGQNRARVGRSGQGKQGAFPFLCANLRKKTLRSTSCKVFGARQNGKGLSFRCGLGG